MAQDNDSNLLFSDDLTDEELEQMLSELVADDDDDNSEGNNNSGGDIVNETSADNLSPSEEDDFLSDDGFDFELELESLEGLDASGTKNDITTSELNSNDSAISKNSTISENSNVSENTSEIELEDFDFDLSDDVLSVDDSQNTPEDSLDDLDIEDLDIEDLDIENLAIDELGVDDLAFDNVAVDKSNTDFDLDFSLDDNETSEPSSNNMPTVDTAPANNTTETITSKDSLASFSLDDATLLIDDDAELNVTDLDHGDATSDVTNATETKLDTESVDTKTITNPTPTIETKPTIEPESTNKPKITLTSKVADSVTEKAPKVQAGVQSKLSPEFETTAITAKTTKPDTALKSKPVIGSLGSVDKASIKPQPIKDTDTDTDTDTNTDTNTDSKIHTDLEKNAETDKTVESKAIPETQPAIKKETVSQPESVTNKVDTTDRESVTNKENTISNEEVINTNKEPLIKTEDVTDIIQEEKATSAIEDVSVIEDLTTTENKPVSDTDENSQSVSEPTQPQKTQPQRIEEKTSETDSVSDLADATHSMPKHANSLEANPLEANSLKTNAMVASSQHTEVEGTTNQSTLNEVTGIDVDNLGHIKNHTRLLKSYLSDMEAPFLAANQVSSQLTREVRQLQNEQHGQYAETHQQTHELRTSLINARKQFIELLSLVDLVEETLESEYSDQIHRHDKDV